MDAAYKAFERSAALILASENWATGYTDAPVQHARLIRATARLERKLLVFFKDVAREAPNRYINWHAYLSAVHEVKASRLDAYDVEVIVNDNTDDTNTEFVNVVFDTVAYGIGLGAQAGETTYAIPTGISAMDAAIQRQARKQVSQLVGKRVQPDGSVIDNPNASYVISNTTRKQIQDSIHTSIMLGDDVQTAAARIQKIIRDPKRAQLIAHQEMANAYTSGLHMYGDASGAVGKEWQTNGAVDICATNAAAGPIPFKAAYPSGDQHPTAHIGCKCYERLIYQYELDQNPDLFGKPETPVAKPKTTPRASQLSVIKREEDAIRHNPLETFVAVDKQGTVVSKLDGSKSRVNISKETISRLKDDGHIVMSHNHPSSGSFSLADIDVAISTNAAEMRVASTKYDYSIKRPETGWPSEQALMRSYKYYEKKQRTKFYQQLANKEITLDYANMNHMHEVNVILAKKYGYEYERRPNN